MRLMLTAAVAALVASPLAADNHAADLETVLAADMRDDDRARDQYRNPAETLPPTPQPCRKIAKIPSDLAEKELVF